MDQRQRPRFYEGQYLGADDLAALEEYPRVQDARHALGAHTWGVAIGLDIVEKTLPSGAIENFVTPGYAWDGYGRPIVVLAPVKISPQLFVNFQGTTPPDGMLVKVWLRYAEQETQNRPAGYEACGVADQTARIVETYALEVGEPMSGENHTVTIAGSAVDALAARSTYDRKGPIVFDESVPFQDFPEDDKSRWLVPIGYLRWLQSSSGLGQFVPRVNTAAQSDSDIIRSFRHYIGVVAEALEAADGVIRLRDRGADPGSPFHPPTTNEDPENPNDLVWVEGNLRVEGTARIAGGQVEWRTAEGAEGDTPTAIRRSENGKGSAQPGGRRLEVVIGKSAGQDDSRFAIGPIQNAGGPAASTDPIVERLTVLSSGLVGINNDAPKSSLHLNTLTVVDESSDVDGVWASFGQNSHFNGTWVKADSSRDGVSIHMNPYGITPYGSATEFRFLKDDAAHGLRNIAVIGSQTSFINEGNFGVGTTTPAPAAKLDVNGRIMRWGQDFTHTGFELDGKVVSPPSGVTGDWSIFVAPRSSGNPADLPITSIECSAKEVAGGFQITAKYGRSDGNVVSGTANYLLVPK